MVITIGSLPGDGKVQGSLNSIKDRRSDYTYYFCRETGQ